MCFENKNITQELYEVQLKLNECIKNIMLYTNNVLTSMAFNKPTTNETLINCVKTCKTLNSQICEFNIHMAKLKRLNCLVKLQELEKEVN